MEEKIEILKSLNSDEARFILKVIQSFQKKEQNLSKKKEQTKIQKKTQNTIIGPNDIDLDTIWAKPYLYTNMRQRLECLVRMVEQSDKNEILRNTKKFCKSVIYNKAGVKLKKDNTKIDIVDFVKNIELNNINSSNVTFYSNEIDEEALFKEDQITKAIKFLEEKDIEKRSSLIYDEICQYLNEDFLSNKYCDFIDNKCIAQRNHAIYPFTRKNGCCFMNIKPCPNLINGRCTVECIGCKLFACNYLAKMGVGYWAEDFILLKVFFTKKQRVHFVFDFYKPKDEVLYKINKMGKI